MHGTIESIRKKRRDDEGFTLIELLVVVVIIGVLVAIAVPVYLNYRKGAADKSAQSDVRGAISAIEQFYTENGNTYPASAPEKTGTFDIGTTPQVTQKITLSDKTTLTVAPQGTSPNFTHYKVCAKNGGGSGKVYLYDSSVGGSVTAASGTINMATCAAGTP
jgi:type IV pilus assembly protein PilA